MPDPNDQNNQQPPVLPVFADPTQMGDASQVISPAATQPSQAAADATAGNQPVVQEVQPQVSTVSSMKPTRGKVGPKGIIATVFGILLLAGAVVAGTTLVQQNQDIREKASNIVCEEQSTKSTCPTSQCFWTGGDGEVNGACVSGCGQAGNICSSGETCVSGACLDLTNDRNNCGQVRNVCGNQQTCQNGECHSGGSCTGLWYRFACPYPGPGTDGQGCSIDKTQVNSSNDFIANFCGAQQIDCSNDPNVSYSNITTGNPPCGGASPTPGATTEPGWGECGSCHNEICIEGGNPGQHPDECVTTPEGTCVWDPGKCGETSNPKPQCENIGISNGNKNGIGGFNELPANKLKALQPGDVVYLFASGRGQDTVPRDYTKARFIINGAAPVVTSKYNDFERDMGDWIDRRRQIYMKYTIPAGVTKFTIKSDVFRAGTWY